MPNRGETIQTNREQRRLLRKKDVAAIIPCTIRGLELMIKAGRIPKPFYVSDASPRWREADIDEWLERLSKEAQESGEVAQ